MQKELKLKPRPAEAELISNLPAEIHHVEEEVSIASPEMIMPPLGQISGEITASDVEMPYLKIVQGVGESSVKYMAGSIVMSNHVLAKPSQDPTQPSEPVYLTVLKGKKVYREKIPWGQRGNARGRMVDTLHEVESAGGTINGPDANWGEEMRATILIRATTPEMKALFNLEAPNGDKYALSMWYLNGVTWSAARTIIAAAATTLTKGCYTWEWKLQVRKEQYGRGVCFVPKLALAAEHSADTLSWIRSIIK